MKLILSACLLILSLGHLGCAPAEFACPEGYAEQFISTFGFRVCLPDTWSGEEMKRMDPVSGQEMVQYIFREEPIPGNPLVSLEKFDFWGFEDDFQTFKLASQQDAASSGQNMMKVEKGSTKNGTPYWMTELSYREGNQEVMAQNYYFFPEGDYSRAFIMRGFSLSEVFPDNKEIFRVASSSFAY